MRLLLDTHLLIWAAIDTRRIRAVTKTIIEDPANDVAFSVASIWEMTIKASLPRHETPVDAQRLRTRLIDNGYVEVEIRSAHALAVRQLPLFHSDSFDRMLIAQAWVEGMTLLTVDRRMLKYGNFVRRA